MGQSESKFNLTNQKCPFLAKDLQAKTVRDVLNIRDAPQGMISIPSEFSLEQAMSVLNENKILCAPVLDTDTKEVLGLVDMYDILTYVLQLYGDVIQVEHEDVNWEEGFVTVFRTKVKPLEDAERTLEALSEEFFSKSLVSEVVNLSGRNPSQVTVNMDTTVDYLVEAMEFGKLHRILVTEPNDTKPFTIITQTDLLNFLAVELTSNSSGCEGSLFDRTLVELQLGTEKQPWSVQTGELAIQAFKVLFDHGVTCIPVLDGDTLVTQVSVTDLRGLKASNFSALLLNVVEYLRVYADTPAKSVTVGAGTKFGECIQTLYENNLHRVWVVDANQELLGVVTLSDIISLMSQVASSQK